MPARRASLIALGLVVPLLPLAAADSPDPDEVAVAMRKAAAFYVSKLASHGGYASAWSEDLSLAFAEGKESRTLISIQPPGTTTVGLALLKAWQATGDESFLAGARGAAKALIDCQLESGGWPADFDFEGDGPKRWRLRKGGSAKDDKKRSNASTLDDNKTQSAMFFLLEYTQDAGGWDDHAAKECLAYAFDRVLAAQTKIGSWPQQFDGPADPEGIVKKATLPATWPRVFPKEKYTGYHTLNDGNLERLVLLLLRAHELTGEVRFLEAAKRCGDFLLLAQFEGSQPAWAQQYNEEMTPVWARKFEPPALASTESFSACLTLFEIWLATGEEKYKTAIPRALDWLEASRLPDGRWARFYELKTNKPLYCVAETYELTYDDAKLPTHYGFKIDSIEDKIPRLRQALVKPREDLLASRRDTRSSEGWAKEARNLRGKVRNALEDRNDEGVWSDEGRIDAGLFTKHLFAMAAYLEASKRAAP